MVVVLVSLPAEQITLNERIVTMAIAVRLNDIIKVGHGHPEQSTRFESAHPIREHGPNLPVGKVLKDVGRADLVNGVIRPFSKRINFRAELPVNVLIAGDLPETPAKIQFDAAFSHSPLSQNRT